MSNPTYAMYHLDRATQTTPRRYTLRLTAEKQAELKKTINAEIKKLRAAGCKPDNATIQFLQHTLKVWTE